jgi:hypothetical protein
MNQQNVISQTCRNRLHVQGYQNYSEQELTSFRTGIRFAYALCAVLFGLGLAFSEKTTLLIAAVVALLGALLPRHPFDYAYNYGVRHLFGNPAIPQRTNQSRFACGIASLWLVTIIILLQAGHILLANLLGGVLLTLALLVSTTDICVPSMIYNSVFRRAQSRMNQLK